MTKLVWKDAEEDFADYFVQFGKLATVYKFQDTREAMGTTGSRRVFTQSRPSDFLITHDGLTYFAEVKSSSHATSFPFSGIRPDQWKYAILTTAAKGFYFFYIRSEYLGQWFKIPASFLISLRKQDFKSIKWTDLQPYFFEMK